MQKWVTKVGPFTLSFMFISISLQEYFVCDHIYFDLTRPAPPVSRTSTLVSVDSFSDDDFDEEDEIVHPTQNPETTSL